VAILKKTADQRLGSPPTKENESLVSCSANRDRRDFFARLAAVAIGAIITLFPFVAGLLVFADPLRRRGTVRGFLKVTTLDGVSDDGIPRAFPVVAGRSDAWTYWPSQPIGAVFLRRIKGQAKPNAWQAICPHAGCMIDYLTENGIFRCPCHNSAFRLDGAIIAPSPSPRRMDELTCEVRENHGVKEIWVNYESFQSGIAEKVPKG
jgi:menaquinol-cytochrome c reductase iron-sulfur subunit